MGRLNFPRIQNEERKKELVKDIRKTAEEAKSSNPVLLEGMLLIKQRNAKEIKKLQKMI